MQSSVLVPLPPSKPEQSAPPQAGAGLVHVRLQLRVPGPQEAEQASQDHVVQLPLTGVQGVMH
ncbi:MAG: hypothetical protein HY591_05310 [Candidatus Omnitrophica bacterium]|nr:hypothetical protein [Candidatus Omnitrophota bacterium]